MKPYFDEDGITIYNGDCREVLPLIADASADVIWTDPPYGHDNHAGDLNARLNEHRDLESQPIANDSPDLMREVVDAALLQAVRILKPDSCCCCCCGGGGGPKPTFAWVAQRMDTSGLQFFHAVVWDKVNPGLGWRYRRQYEMVMVAHREGGKLAWVNQDEAVPNVYKYYPDRNRVHPNEKPLPLVTYFLRLHAPLGGMVVDPFMGSGTTLRSAKDLGLRAVGIEVEEKYCEIAAKRMAQQCLF